MHYTYTTRFGQRYYLVQSLTKTGKPKFHFAMKEPATPAKLPDGYEAYETAGGQVFLRVKGTCAITPEEVRVVAELLKTLRLSSKFEPWIDKSALTIYEISGGGGEVLRMFVPSATQADIEQMNFSRGTRQAVMRFVLFDKRTRIFLPERYCFRGRVDDWISIGAPGSLVTLAKKFLKHLGKDSLYELF